MSTQERIAALSQEIWEKKQELQKLRREATAEPVKNYTFTDWAGNTVQLSELFADKQDLILIHNMGTSCAYCTMWADGLESSLAYLNDRAAFVLSSPDSPETQKAFATERGWSFPMVSAERDGFIQDMGFADAEHVMPGVSVFFKDEQDNIYRTNKDYFGPYDDYNPVWNLFSLLKSGAADWQPRFNLAR